MGEGRYTLEAVKARKRKTSSAPPKPKKIFGRRDVSFEPPLVPVKVNGDERLLSIKEFFGKTQGEKESYIRESDVIISFIDKLETRTMREEAALYLIEILPKFGSEEPFIEMVKAASEISEFNYGQNASLKFLDRISHLSEDGLKGDALVDVMKAFRSEPILESFDLFSKVGEKTLSKAAVQIVRLGFILKEGEALEKIGKVITHITNKFGFYFTIDYRHILRGIGKSEKIPDENKAKLIHEISDRLLKVTKDEEVDMFSGRILTQLNSSRVDDPEKSILEICETERKYREDN